MEIRFAEPEDLDLVFQFIHDLAAYEHKEDEVVARREDLAAWMFERRTVEVLFAIEDGEEVGFALFFHNFATFQRKAGIYLEDLFVRPEHRGKGCGKGLFAALARLADEHGCAFLEWRVLKWNRPSIGFYESLGGKPLEE